MLTFDCLQIPPPSNWDDFESICCDLFRKIWNDPNTIKNGRQGQPQNGVDIYGRPNQQSKWAGVQCKKRDYLSNKSLTKKELDSYLEEVKSFEPTISQFIICTTAKKNVKIEEYARKITDKNIKNNLFSVHVWGWDDIKNQIASYSELIQKYWPNFYLIDPKILKKISSQLNPFYIFNYQWIQEQLKAKYNLRFYEGFQATWSNIIYDHDIMRDQFSEVFEKSLKLRGNRALLVLLSEMGEGKSIFLKRLAVELYKNGNIVLYHKESLITLTADQIIVLAHEINNDFLSKQSIFVFIDNVTRFIGFQEFVNDLAENNIKVIIVVTSNIGEWQDTNFVLTGNLDCDPTEIRLSNQLSSKEAKAITKKLQKHVKKPLEPTQFQDKNFLIAMMQVTNGKGFKEIIKGRIQLLNKKNPILLTAYLYTCLLSQYGLSMPISLLQSLLTKHDIYTEILSEPLFEELIKYGEDPCENTNSITAGNELYAITVIEQQFSANTNKQPILLEMLSRIIQNIPIEQRSLVISLLINIGQRNANLAHNVIKNCQGYIVSLQNFSTADEFSRGWAKLYAIIKDYENAEESYLISIDKEKNSHFLSRYAWFLKERGRFLEAKKYLELATTTSPNDVGAHSMLGRLLKLMLLYEDAAREFEIVLQKSSNKAYFCNIGPIYLQILKYLKHYEKAIEICNNLIYYSPLNKVNWSIMLMQLFLLSRDLPKAHNQIIKILNEDPSLVKKLSEIISQSIKFLNITKKEKNELKELIETYIPVVQSIELTEQFKNIIFEKETESAYYTELISDGEQRQDKIKLKKRIISKVQEMINNKQLDSIPEYLDSIIEENKYNTIAQLAFADYLITYKKPEDAEDHLISAIVFRNPTDYIPILHYACYLIKFKRFIDSQSYFLYALNIPNLSYRILQKITFTYLRTLLISNYYNEAILTLLQKKELVYQKSNLILNNILSFENYCELEKLYLENHLIEKDPKELVSFVENNLISFYPQCILGYSLQGQILSLEGNTIKAYSAFEQGIKLNQNAVETQVKYAHFLLEESRFLEKIDTNIYLKFINLAIGYSEISFKKEPNNLYITNTYASALFHARKTPDADKIIEKALNTYGDNVFLLINSADIKVKLGLWDIALSLYYKAIDITANQLLAYAHGALGRAFLYHGNFDDAKKHLEEAQIISKFGSKSCLDMGDWHLKCGNLSRAKSEYIRAINNSPTFTYPYFKLAYLYHQKGQIDKSIIEYATCAVQFWRKGQMLATAKAGYLAFLLLYQTDDEKLKLLSFTCGILSSLALFNNPYTEQISPQIFSKISKKLEEYPNIFKILQSNKIYLNNFLLNNNVQGEDLIYIISLYLQQITK